MPLNTPPADQIHLVPHWTYIDSTHVYMYIYMYVHLVTLITHSTIQLQLLQLTHILNKITQLVLRYTIYCCFSVLLRIVLMQEIHLGWLLRMRYPFSSPVSHSLWGCLDHTKCISHWGSSVNSAPTQKTFTPPDHHARCCYQAAQKTFTPPDHHARCCYQAAQETGNLSVVIN